MKRILPFVLLLSSSIFAQERVTNTFNSTRIINGHSNETLKKRELEYRIEHRFGDIAGAAGGSQNFYGFDNAADIRFAFEYGFSNRLMGGFGRNKGAGNPYKALLDGFLKYRIIDQSKGLKSFPISITAMSGTTLSYAKASKDLTRVDSYPKFEHRLAYFSQLILTRKFGERISLAVLPTYVHRNRVLATDQNGLVSIGYAANIQFYKNFGFIFEYFQNINAKGVDRSNYTNSMSVGLEWLTNGHAFHFNFTNAKGFAESQFIPYTDSKWSKGQFRFAFSVSRKFKR